MDLRERTTPAVAPVSLPVLSRQPRRRSRRACSRRTNHRGRTPRTNASVSRQQPQIQAQYPQDAVCTWPFPALPVSRKERSLAISPQPETGQQVFPEFENDEGEKTIVKTRRREK